VSPSTTSPSRKRTTSHNVRCDVCGFWYENLHPAMDLRDLCRMCLELERQNRSERGK
jgi:formylmethanofuran dehydrogenase subunit E